MSADFHTLALPPAIEALARDVHREGGRTWLVGGGVRDHLLGRPVKDFDVEIHRIPPIDLERLLLRLGRVNTVGRSFGVFKLRPRGRGQPEIDVSIPRRDIKTGPGHRGITIQGDPFLSLDEAVARRDLTINALMVDVLTRELYDRVGGLDDLREKRLRAVDPRTFLEDPLRALRVVQLASRTGFQPDDTLLDLCRSAPLDELPPERIHAEWEKLLLTGEHLAHASAIARATTILSRAFPERIDEPHLDEALERAIPTRDALDHPGARWVLMLGIWLARTPLTRAEATLDRLCIYTISGFPVRKQLLGILTHLDDPIETDADLRRLSVHAELRLALAIRDALAPSRTIRRARRRAAALHIEREAPTRLLRGRDLAALGMRSGPTMGALLEEAYAQQLEGTLQTHEDAIRWARARLEGGR